MLQPPLAVATVQFVFCLVFLASEGAATVDDFCTDVSYWDVLKYQTTTKQCCKTKLKQICTFKSDHVCEEVPEIQCEVVSWPLCESTSTLTESKKCEVEYQDYPYINCNDVKSSITHTRKVPECKEVISQNCVTDWKVNANGNKVWGGTETCTPVRWEECEIVERQVELPVMRTECATGSTIKWADVVDKTKHVAGLNTHCQVKSSVDCKKKAVTKCASVSWEECSMVPVDECQPVVVYTPSQEKIHRKSCFNPNIPATTTASSSSFDYCTISNEHTMCKYTGPSASCKANTVKRELSDTDKQVIVDKHNELRRKVAKGLETRGNPGPQPAASDMLLMVWDDELATIAQRWADQCTFGHDDKRGIKDGYVGQNAAISSSSAEMTDAALAVSYVDATTSWYEEVNVPGFNKDSVNTFVSSSGIGHYTQVVWASSRAVGCGSVYYNSGSGSFPYNQLIICNYFKGGNLQGGAMYSLGNACEACPAGYPTCSDALCTV